MKNFLIIFLSVFLCMSVRAAPSELAQINAQIKKTQAQNDAIAEKVKTSQRDVEKTKKQLVRTGEKVSVLEDQRGAMIKKISELDARREKLNQLLAENHARIKNAAGTILFVAANPSFDVENMHEYVLMSAVLSGAAENFDAEIKTVNAQLQELEEVLDKRATEKEKLDRTAKKYASEKKDLDKLLKTRSAQNEKLKTQQSALQKKLSELSARAKNISELSAGVGSSEMSGDSKFSSRKMNPPLRGNLTVRFGEKTALGLQSDGWRIRTRGDALVVAPADGVVKFADTFKGFGRVIIMSHKNGYNTVMTNMGEISVVLDQEMLAGEPIGRMSASKPEMYIEVRRGNRAIDPARLFKEP